MTRRNVLESAKKAAALLGASTFGVAVGEQRSTDSAGSRQRSTRLGAASSLQPFGLPSAAQQRGPSHAGAFAPASLQASPAFPVHFMQAIQAVQKAGSVASAAESAGNASFGPEQVAQLQASNRVLLLEYSSTGGGHTDRSLLPVKQALEDGVIAKGDTVVMFAPPRWAHDHHGSHVNKLHNRKSELEAAGVHVILKQTDKTVTGLYKADGASDNVAMLRDFVYKPRRGDDVDLSVKLPESDNPRPRGPAQSAKSVLDDVIRAVGSGNKDKILVIGDMAPYLQKAAKARGIATRVEIGNHQALFVGVGRKSLDGKDLSYLHKASAAGLPDKLALIDYNTRMNVLPELPSTFKALGIEPGTTKAQAREIALQHLMQHGERTSLVKGDKAKPGILVSRHADPSTIKAMVYLYVNDYTQGLVDHIRDKIEAEPKTYGRALFAICGSEAFKKGQAANKAPNIMHVMYSANADGVTSAGFGTTSEFHYLHKNGYEGKFIVAPVENQHEQGANAAELKDICAPGAVMPAHGLDDITRNLDHLVAARAGEEPGRGWNDSMLRLSDAVARKSAPDEPATSNVGHAAQLLASPPGEMSDKATKSVTAMAAYDATDAPKQRRRMYKLVVPALDSMIKDSAVDAKRPKPTPFSENGQFQVLATKKAGVSQSLDVRTAIDLMRTASRVGPEGDAALHGLLQVEFSSIAVKNQLMAYANLLESLQSIEDAQERSAAAQHALETLAQQNIALGW